MNIQEKLNAQKKEVANMAPREVLEVMERATKDLKRSGTVERAKKEGDEAPDFTLNNAGGEPVHLADRLSDGPVVLGFYRGRW